MVDVDENTCRYLTHGDEGGFDEKVESSLRVLPELLKIWNVWSHTLNTSKPNERPSRM
ncbi:MAG: hypothetical protein QW101_01895 [Ignisphaera sp.]